MFIGSGPGQGALVNLPHNNIFEGSDGAVARGEGGTRRPGHAPHRVRSESLLQVAKFEPHLNDFIAHENKHNRDCKSCCCCK